MNHNINLVHHSALLSVHNLLGVSSKKRTSQAQTHGSISHQIVGVGVKVEPDVDDLVLFIETAQEDATISSGIGLRPHTT